MDHNKKQLLLTHTPQLEKAHLWSPCGGGLVTKWYPTLVTLRTVATRLLYPWDFPSKNTGVGYHSLLQEIFTTQELNSNLLHWQADSLPPSLLGSPF